MLIIALLLIVALQTQSGPPDVLPAAAASKLRESIKAASAHKTHLWRDTLPFDQELVNAIIEIPRGERLRSDSASRPDNIWGFPSYAFVEGFKNPKVWWQVFVEPLFADYYTPHAGRVFRGMEREFIVYGSPLTYEYSAEDLASVDDLYRLIKSSGVRDWSDDVSAGIEVLEVTARPDSWYGGDMLFCQLHGFIRCMAATESISEFLSFVDRPLKPIRPFFIDDERGEKVLILPGDPAHHEQERPRMLLSTRYDFP